MGHVFAKFVVMIVPSMSHLEICNALFSDLPKLKIWYNMHIPKMVKQFKKERKFPAWKWEEYIHQQSRNKYLIIYYVPSAELVDRPEVSYVAFMEEDKQRLVIEWRCLPYRQDESMDFKFVRAINLFCPHFFKRYRERIWKNSEMSYNDLLCRYFSRNKTYIPLKLNEDIQRNYEKYSEYSYSFQQNDGVCFVEHAVTGDEMTIGTPEDKTIVITLYYTIVSNSMMSELQKKAIEKGGKEYMQDYFNSFLEDAKKDAIYRRHIAMLNN